MAKQPSMKIRILLFAFLTVGIASLAIVLDYVYVSPIHESGHLLGCWALGVRVVKVEWTRTEFVPVFDWRENVIGFMGGFWAALLQCSVYFVIGSIFRALSRRSSYSARLQGIVTNFSVIIEAAIMTDILAQITGGIFEGASLTIYRQTFGNGAFAFTVAVVFAVFSLFLQLRKT